MDNTLSALIQETKSVMSYEDIVRAIELLRRQEQQSQVQERKEKGASLETVPPYIRVNLNGQEETIFVGRAYALGSWMIRYYSFWRYPVVTFNGELFGGSKKNPQKEGYFYALFHFQATSFRFKVGCKFLIGDMTFIVIDTNIACCLTPIKGPAKPRPGTFETERWLYKLKMRYGIKEETK